MQCDWNYLSKKGHKHGGGISSCIAICMDHYIDERWVDKATSNTARGTLPRALGFNTVPFSRRYNTHLWLPPHSILHTFNYVFFLYFSQIKTTSLPRNLQPKRLSIYNKTYSMYYISSLILSTLISSTFNSLIWFDLTSLYISAFIWLDFPS